MLLKFYISLKIVSVQFKDKTLSTVLHFLAYRILEIRDELFELKFVAHYNYKTYIYSFCDSWCRQGIKCDRYTKNQVE